MGYSAVDEEATPIYKPPTPTAMLVISPLDFHCRTFTPYSETRVSLLQYLFEFVARNSMQTATIAQATTVNICHQGQHFTFFLLAHISKLTLCVFHPVCTIAALLEYLLTVLT